ncbi:MAG TPA: DHA2 family efflux MFS transporter permease subunit [Patescibacteria group bacterium]|nr:DHA2 family efflux MFS transporter permease subunit [Patescibacteria group bacterium]
MIEKVKHKGLALAVLAAAQFMVILDATIVNVALPAIQKALGFTTASQLQWVVTAYALVFGGFLLLGGRLADLFGRRKIFLMGIALFATASLFAGLSQNPAMLIVFRSLQGLGGALLAPAALSLVLTIFKEGPERNKALGIWSMIAGGGGAVGLLLGGVLTQYVDWRWIFFINIPIAIGVILLALKYVPNSLPQKRESIDFAGAITVTGSLMSLVYALAQAPQKGWGSSVTLGTFAVSIALMVAFIVNEARRKNPLVKLSIFKRRNVSGGTLIQLFTPAALFGMFFYLSIYLQQILHYSPTMTGVADLPFTLILILVAGTLSSRIGKLNAKALLIVAPLIVGAGLAFFARVPLHANYWTDILPGIALMAGGMAVVFVTTTMVTTSGVSHEESGLVSGLLNTAQQIGGALGLAVLAVVSTATTKHDLIAAHGNPAATPMALVHGFQRGFMMAVVFAVAASLVAATILKLHKPSATDLDREEENEAEALAAIPGV